MRTNLLVLATVTNDKIDLSGWWSKLWLKITGATGASGLLDMVAYVGIGVVAVGIIQYFWSKKGSRGGGGGRGGNPMYTLIVGGLLTAPNWGIPLMLWFADLILNAATGLPG